MLSATDESLRQRVQRWTDAAGENATIIESTSVAGGGSLPGEGVPTPCASIRPPVGADKGMAFLRRWEIPIVARVEDGAILLDPRAVAPDDDDAVEAALGALSNETLF